MEQFSRQEIVAMVNKYTREILDSYYKTHTADDFFRIDQILRVARKNELTVDEVPTLIEMQNVIVMGIGGTDYETL